MTKSEEINQAVQKYLDDPDEVVYYTYDNRPDYSINQDTGEITIFSYGYFGHTQGMLMKDIDEIECSGSQKQVIDEIDSRLEKLIDDYNKAKAHNYHAQNSSTESTYYLIKGKIEALLDLREELSNNYYW